MAEDYDLEEELLQVAGRSRGPSRKRARGRRATSDSEDDDAGQESDDLFGSDSDDDNDEDASAAKKQRGRKGASGSKATSPAKKRHDDDYDDDDDADSEEDPGEDGYGSDLYIDDEDRRKLEAMTELEREMILAERAIELDKQRQRRELLKKTQRDTDKGDGRASRSSGRQRRDKEKDSAFRKIEAAKQRQERGGGGRGRDSSDESGSARKRSTRSSGRGAMQDFIVSDDEVEEEARLGSEVEEEEYRPIKAKEQEEEEEDEGAAPRTRSQQEEEEEGEDRAGGRSADRDWGERGERDRGAEREARRLESGYRSEDEEEIIEASHEDLRSIQLLRSQLEAWFDKPFFTGDGLQGCVVRMAYGGGPPDPRSGMQQSYVPMVIQEIKDTGRPYPFGPRQVQCTKYLVLQDGLGITHTMALQSVSNQPLDTQDYDRYLRHCDRGNRPALNKQDVEMAKAKISAAINYRWDSSKVKEMLERKRAQGMLPVNIAAEKSRLRRLLEAAQMEGRVDEVASLEQQLRDLDTRSMAEKPGEQRTYGMSHINKRNQMINFQNTISNVSNKPSFASESSKKQSTADAFSRRNTRPNIYWNTSKAPAEAQLQAAAATTAEADKVAAGKKLKKEMQKMDPADLIKLLDLDVNVDQLQEFSVAPPLAKRLLGNKWTHSLGRHATMDFTNKTILSVAEWKRRAGYM